MKEPRAVPAADLQTVLYIHNVTSIYPAAANEEEIREIVQPTSTDKGLVSGTEKADGKRGVSLYNITKDCALTERFRIMKTCGFLQGFRD